MPQEERRRTFRAAIHQEVVALEHASSQILHVLVSRDMTVDGMRVEPERVVLAQILIEAKSASKIEHD